MKALTIILGLGLGVLAQPSLATAAGAYAPILGATPVYREIKEWVVACDNTRRCKAKYLPSDDGPGDGGYLSIEREPGPVGPLTVTLEGLEETTPNPASLRLDGRPLAALAWTIDRKAQTATLRGTDAAAFVHAIREGSSLTYSSSKDAPSVSLSGMTAALLAIDDDQGRLGGATALVRPGPAPAAAVPAAGQTPVVYARPVKDDLQGAVVLAKAVRLARASVLAKHGCEASEASRDEAHALDDGNAIVILGCIEAAYQGSTLAFAAPRNAPEKARQLVFPLEPRLNPQDNTDTSTDGEYTEGSWDAPTASFSESAKGRGLADCGSSTTWTYDGSVFHLSAYNAQVRCGGGLAGDWPTLYRTRVVKR